jgi:hypothetical protein
MSNGKGISDYIGILDKTSGEQLSQLLNHKLNRTETMVITTLMMEVVPISMTFLLHEAHQVLTQGNPFDGLCNFVSVVVSPFRFEDILEFWGSGCMKITGQN